MNLSPFVVLTMMYTFAFSMKDEEDEDYEPKVEVRRILTNIPKFPDISAFGREEFDRYYSRFASRDSRVASSQNYDYSRSA